MTSFTLYCIIYITIPLLTSSSNQQPVLDIKVFQINDASIPNVNGVYTHEISSDHSLPNEISDELKQNGIIHQPYIKYNIYHHAGHSFALIIIERQDESIWIIRRTGTKHGFNLSRLSSGIWYYDTIQGNIKDTHDLSRSLNSNPSITNDNSIITIHPLVEPASPPSRPVLSLLDAREFFTPHTASSPDANPSIPANPADLFPDSPSVQAQSVREHDDTSLEREFQFNHLKGDKLRFFAGFAIILCLIFVAWCCCKNTSKEEEEEFFMMKIVRDPIKIKPADPVLEINRNKSLNEGVMASGDVKNEDVDLEIEEGNHTIASHWKESEKFEDGIKNISVEGDIVIDDIMDEIDIESGLKWQNSQGNGLAVHFDQGNDDEDGLGGNYPFTTMTGHRDSQNA